MAGSRGLKYGFLLLALVLADVAKGCVITMRNNCPYAITACSQGQGGSLDQFNIGAGGSLPLDFGGFGCKWTGGVIYVSVTGRCKNAAGGATDRNLANIAEFTLAGWGNTDFYDLSNIDAYTIPMQIRNNRGCRQPYCRIDDISRFCGANNRLVQHFSGGLSCVNTDGPRSTSPTAGTRQFKARCADSYSFSKDDPTSLFSCPTGTDYEVVFCA